MRVGILALQGAVVPHAIALKTLGHVPVVIKRAAEVHDVDGLILPGGESTTMRRLLDPELHAALDRRVACGVPVLATCAGLILAAREIIGGDALFGWLDIQVARNAWGRQIDSFESISDRGRAIVLIRAPRIKRCNVDIVDTFRNEPILVRYEQIWGATFHPELTTDTSLHAAVFGASVDTVISDRDIPVLA